MNGKEVIEILRRQVGVYGSQKFLAERIGISPQYLGDILQGKREVGQKVLDWLRLEKRVSYKYKEEK